MRLPFFFGESRRDKSGDRHTADYRRSEPQSEVHEAIRFSFRHPVKYIGLVLIAGQQRCQVDSRTRPQLNRTEQTNLAGDCRCDRRMKATSVSGLHLADRSIIDRHIHEPERRPIEQQEEQSKHINPVREPLQLFVPSILTVARTHHLLHSGRALAMLRR